MLAAYTDRFPTNDLNEQLVDSRVEDEETFPDEGKTSFIRIVTIAPTELPWIVRKATGLSFVNFHTAVTIDYRARSMDMTTRNIELRKRFVLDEVCHYRVDPEDSRWTIFEQTATVAVPGVPSSIAPVMEDFLTSQYEKGIGEGRKIDQKLIERRMER